MIQVLKLIIIEFMILMISQIPILLICKICTPLIEVMHFLFLICHVTEFLLKIELSSLRIFPMKRF